MMKKTLCAFLMILVSGIANANIHIDGKKAREIVLKHIDQEHQVPALQEYNVQLKATGNFTMSAAGLYKVCTAAGWDIVKPEGKTKCEDFVKALVAESDYKYYEVCGKDKGKSGGTEYCVDNVFYSLIGGIQVTMLQADGLAKEYVRLNYKGDDIECSSQTRKGTINPLNDYVKCTSKLNPTYYEFKFDDVVESLDINITASVEKAICNMYGVDYMYKYSSQTSTFSNPGYTTFYPAKCKTSDANLCSKINESMKKFGYSTKIQKDGCVISENTIHSESQLRTAFGIDNLHFRRGYQLSSYAGMRTQLCEYIEKNANTAITSCECNYNRTQLMKGSDNNIEDVLTCYANGQPIDFLFDDLSEHSKTVRQGNMEAFACSVLGGEYQGKTCFTPDKKLCEQIAAATLSECPECAKAYYDETLKSCVLPNATKANEHQKKVNIGLIIGGAVVGAGIIIYTGGTGFAAVAVTLETIGAGMELGAQIHIDGVADEFFMKANNCNDATCAESILKEYFQYISRMTNDLQSGEKLGIDSKMATLVEMLPDDSQFLIDTVAGCYEDNGDNFDISKCDDGVWNNDQIIRAVGIGLQFTSVFASVGKWVLGAGRVQKIASKTPGLTKALSKKIPGVKQQIITKTTKGKPVKLSNGKDFVIPKGMLSEDANNTILKLAKRKLDWGGSSFDEIYKGYLAGGPYPASWRTSDLTQRELDILNQAIAKDGNKLIDDGKGYLIFTHNTGTLSVKPSIAKAMERFDNYGKGFLETWKYDIDATANTWEEVLRKWNLPSDASDDIIENTYRRMLEDLNLYDTRGDSRIASNQADLIASVKNDYEKIKKTKPNFGKVVTGARTIVSEQLYNAGKAYIDNEQVMARQVGLSISKDSELMRFETEYLDEIAKARNNADVENAWRKYHQNVVNHLASKFNESRTLQIARQRQDMYIDIIASDPDLSYMALSWKELSGSQKQDFLRKLLERSNQRLCSGGSCSLSLSNGLGGATDYMRGGNIEIGLAGGSVRSSNGCTKVIRPNDNLNDAILAFAHEHGHSITLNSPHNSSIDPDLIGMAIVHNEDDAGRTFTRISANSGNYANQITEKEGLLIGDAVGDDFERKLMQRIEQSGVKATKTSGITIDKVVDELWDSTGYNASITQAADDFELLSEKFGIQQYFGSYEPRNVDEATQMLRRIQDQLYDTEQILDKYANELGETDDYFRTRNIFERDKDIAEDYIRHLNDYVKRGGFGIEGVVSELSERVGYEAMELTPAKRFGIIQEFGGEDPFYREDAVARLQRVEDILEDTKRVLSKHIDDFKNVDDWDRLLYTFKGDEEWAENYMGYLRDWIRINDSL